MKYKNSLLEMVGNTPLIKLNSLKKNLNLKGNIYAKVEYFNPTGSIKDRAALKMIEDAESKGLLKEGGTIIEPTSGNTGIGISLIASIKGYKSIIVMPETMSEERRRLIAAYGSKLVLTEGAKGMAGSIEKANELQKTIENSIILAQFDNKSNVKAHYETTGPEIYDALEGNVDYLVAGIGTGGTITGIGTFLKEKKDGVKIIGIEPSGSPVITEGKKGGHKIQGIGPGFIPSILDLKVIDKVETITNEEAFDTCKVAVSNEGLLVGISSGAALCEAIKLASLDENEGKNIVVILPDTGTRYLSVPSFLD